MRNVAPAEVAGLNPLPQANGVRAGTPSTFSLANLLVRDLQKHENLFEPWIAMSRPRPTRFQKITSPSKSLFVIIHDRRMIYGVSRSSWPMRPPSVRHSGDDVKEGKGEDLDGTPEAASSKILSQHSRAERCGNAAHPAVA